MNTQIQITQKGYDKLKVELDALVTKKRPHLVDRLENARSQGDLAENSDYQSAKDELEFLDGRIDELKAVLENAQIVAGAGNGHQVDIGTKVNLKIDGENVTYEIVGEWEAKPTEQKISHSSPLGQALVGKKVGDKVEVDAPAGKITYEILAIN